MKKIVLSIIIVIFGYGLYTFLQPPKSPKDQSTYSKNSKNYIIDYSRPYKKNRLIFGDKDDQALVPYNQYWRTGANFSTDLTVSDDFIFGDESVSKGSYWLYTIPNKNTWKVILNSDKIKKFFKWEPKTNIAQGLEECIKHAKTIILNK